MKAMSNPGVSLPGLELAVAVLDARAEVSRLQAELRAARKVLRLAERAVVDRAVAELEIRVDAGDEAIPERTAAAETVAVSHPVTVVEPVGPCQCSYVSVDGWGNMTPEYVAALADLA
jgi:hypothetical protein